MEKLKRYGLPIYWVITIISVALIVLYLVVNFGFEKPKTSGYEYFNGIKIESDNLEDSSEIPIIEFNVTRSDTNPELNLTEMIITEYTDYEHNSYNRYAVQVLGDIYYSCPAGASFSYDSPDFRAYSTIKGKNSDGTHSTSNVYYYVIDVDGDVRNSTYDNINYELRDLDVVAGDTNFKLQVGGADSTYTYQNTYYSRKGWDDWNKWFNNTKTVTYTNEYNVVDLFGYLAKAFEIKESNVVKSFDNVDLDKYFTITKENEKGQYYSLKDVTTNHAYFRVKCTYTDITSHLSVENNSIIGAIAGDVNYSSGVQNITTPYYSTGVELTLMGNEFLPARYSNIDGVILTLSSDFRAYLLSLNNLILNIDINLDTLACDDDIVGIDLSSLGNLKITNFNIESGSVKDFYIIGTSNKIVNATYSPNLNLLNGNGGVYE